MDTAPQNSDSEGYRKTISSVMSCIAKAVANAIAKAWEGTRDLRQVESAPMQREIRIDLLQVGSPGYEAEIVRSAAMDVAMGKPKQLVRLPDLPQVGQVSGQEQSDCGQAWVRWRVWYDGHAAKQCASIDWASDID